LSLVPGTYRIEASKVGYGTGTTEVTVLVNTNSIADFSLEQEAATNIIQYLFGLGIENNKFVAGIEVSGGETSTTHIYDPNITITAVLAVQGLVSFTVTGPEGENGLILLSINDTKKIFNHEISNMDNLKVTIDGVSIQKTSEVGNIFSTSNNENAEPIWTSISIDEQLYVLVKADFSQHQIAISLVEEVLSGFFAIGVYVVICVLIALFIVIPIFFIEKK
jgi:hypothetical protein